MTKVLDWFEQPYAEKKDNLNAWVEEQLRWLSVDLFHEQQKIVHMAGETDNGLPRFKDGAIAEIHNILMRRLSHLHAYMVSRILVSYLKGNIEPNQEVEEWIADSLSEAENEEFWNELNYYIWDDYVEHLGRKRVEELWEKWGKAPLED